jgi:hypothetical protein
MLVEITLHKKKQGDNRHNRQLVLMFYRVIPNRYMHDNKKKVNVKVMEQIADGELAALVSGLKKIEMFDFFYRRTIQSESECSAIF